MRKTTFKRSLAFGLSVVMALSMTACGGKGGNDGKDSKTKENVKNMVYTGEDIDLAGVKGDLSSFVISGDKFYFLTSEWPEEAFDGTDGEDIEGSKEDVTTEETSEEGATTEEVTEEGATTEEVTEEDATTEEATEEETTEETSEDKTEETSEDETTEEAVAEDTGNEDEYEVTNRLYSMNLDGTDIKELGEPAFDAGEYISYIIAGKDGKLSLLTSRWGSEEEGQTCYIASLDDSFNVTDHIDITKELGLSNETYIAKALADDKGNLVVITNDSAIVLDKDLKKVGELKSDNNYIEAAAKTKDGQIICASSGEEGAIVQVADLDAKKFGEKFKLDGMNYFSSSDAVMDGYGKYDFFYKDESGIYGYSISDKKGTKVLDYLASEIDSNRTYGIVPMGEETFIGQSWEETGSILTKYTKVDPSQVKDKETIVFASLWSVDDTIRSAAIKFNKESDKYRITFKDYNDEEDPVSKMNADIIAGNVADIMDVSYMPVGQYVAKGILEDLTPYYDKDEEVSKDDIIPSVEKAMEIEGKLYYVAPSFSINTVIASKKDVGDKTGWTFDELKALLEEKGDDVRPFYSENKVDILSSFLYSNLNDYIDWTTGECRFSSDDFKSVLEIANRGTNEEMDYSEDMPSEPSLIKSGKVLLTAGWMDTDYIQTYSKMYNSDISLIGYPCEDKNGSYFSFDSRLGIYSKSNYKDGAWEFIKTLMTKDYQATGGHIWNNPTNKDAFECYMKTKTATEKYTDEYGVEVEPNESSWGWEDMEIKIGPLSKEEEQMYRDLINNTTKVTESNDAIMEIINEEAKNYFSGQKSLDETADIIQNRVTTYVNENR